MLKEVFFTNLRNKLNAIHGENEVVGVISSLLSKSKSTIYKKLRSEIDFSVDELLTLCSHYNLSLDLLSKSNSDHSFFFELPFQQIQIENASQFIGQIAKELSQMAYREDFRVYYATREIPLFYHFYYPELAKFKAYAFMRTAWIYPQNKKQRFSFNSDIFDFSFEQISQQLISGFSKVPSIEYWCGNVLDTTLNQLEYFVQGGKFEDRRDALVIIESLYNLVADLSKMCTEGQKFNNTNSFDGSGSFDLYINDLTHTGNVILAKSKSLTTFYITLDNPNYLKSNDKLICDYAEKWMHKIESYSDRITNSNSRSSMRLFSILNEKIAQSEKLIKVLI